jgi:NAD(P)-dependent dehydrogenase (short-subunit alcohol dehydrogenase family)
MRNYLIIGGSSGIGQAIVHRLSKNPNNAVWASFFKGEFLQREDGVHYFGYDVHNDFTETLPEVLDGVVYCPGTIDLKPFHRFGPNAFLDDFQIQLTGAVRVLQAALPSLKKANTGSVVLFSTLAVQQGLPFHSLVSASKGAVEGLTKALAAEWAPKIRVNAVAPSLTDTPLSSKLLSSEEKIKANGERHPLRRIGEAEDIAKVATFLLSEDADWITGQIVHVDGGMSTLRV